MKDLYLPVFLCFFLCSFSAHAQILSNPKYGHRRVPVFRSPADSARYQLFMNLMSEGGENTSKDRKRKRDSLLNLQQSMASLIIGYRTIYNPQHGYQITDSISAETDVKSIRKLSINGKSKIPDVVWKCTELEDIEFVNCSIRRLPSRLRRLNKLKTIRVYNGRSSTHLKLGRNKTVTEFICNGTASESLPKSYHHFRNLKSLDLAENDLTIFPNGGRRNKKLTDLSLQRNKLDLTTPIQRHPYLERLSLHENNIEHVPPSITQFTNLKKLNCNRNKITSVDDAIGTMIKLEGVSFYGNQLVAIPSGLYALRNLKDIDLFHNQIESLEPAFANWSNLQSLFLSHNKLVALPENIDTLRSLEGLYVWDNRLGSIPESLGNMKTLKYLRLNKNYIKEIPASILQLRDLEEIDFAHNYLTSIALEIFELPKLKILSLSVNPWDRQAWLILPEKVEQLRKKDVFVHFGDEE